MKVIFKEDAYNSVKNRTWYPPACEDKDEHIDFLFEGCREMDIVFCKDCKWAEKAILDEYCVLCTMHHTSSMKHGYCHCGRRRDE